MKNTKNQFLTSCISLLLCFVMLLGTTFAWFTDEVTSANNIIQAGNLDIELQWSKDNVIWHNAGGINDKPIFDYDKWEPGYTEVRYLKVKNEGSLAFKYQMSINPVGPVGTLAEVIDVNYDIVTGNNSFAAPTKDNKQGSLTKVGTLDDLINANGIVVGGVLLPEGESAEGYYSKEIVVCVSFHMDENAGNEYQNLSIGDGFGIKLVATQFDYENDSFDNSYDDNAEWPQSDNGYSASATITDSDLSYGALRNDLTIGDANGVGAKIPADVMIADGATSLDLTMKKVDTDGNLNLDNSESATSFDVHIEGIAANNTKPMIVNLGAVLPKNLSDTELKLYHTENGQNNLMTRVASANDFAIHNQYTYDPVTGSVSIYVKSFSVFSAVQATASKWEDSTEADTSWYNDEDTEFTLEDVADFLGFRDLVDAGNTFEKKTVKLGVDIDLNNIPFDPIGFGYWYEKNVVEGKDNNTVFMGTFDGGNHTIYNLYENCWELDPDKTNYGTYTYSTAGAGLFASIKNATIKNLAVSGAEIVFECVDMGVVVGYAQGTCHFENIIVTNSKIANYNRYTGGVVGEVSYGSYGIDTSLGYSHTFKNITVDSSVTVSGLWGSFGCGMGGVIGGKWGDATVLMENVVSAPTMDVYNDVVSAYQWYAFRGCGMLIGHTEEPYSDGRHSGNATASFLTCVNVNVYYGDWVDYTYYKFVNQTDAQGNRLWYSDYPWVRAEEGEYCDAFSNIRYGIPLVNGVKVTELSEEAFNEAVTETVVITFDQLYGADRGMYGTNKHAGVNVSYSSPKTFYIENNLGLKNLILHYIYSDGEETWTTVPDGVELTEMNGVYRIDLPEGTHSFTITADGGYTSKEFILSELTEKETYPVHEHEFVDDKCECGAEKITSTVNILDYAEANGWNNDKQYKEVVIGCVKANAIGGGNTGKYYTNGNNWRIYQSENASILITSESGDIVSVKITYVSDKNGVLQLSDSNIKSGELVEVNSNSITYVVGNTGSATNGQVRITAIEVVYILENHECNQNEVIEGYDATCTTTGLSDGKKCDICKKVTVKQEILPIIDHTWNDATCTLPKTCSVCSATEGDALNHTTDNGICENCGVQIGNTTEPEPEIPSTTNRYYIATKRTSGNYFYMTSNLGTASTKRYQAEDSGLIALPTSINTPESGYVFVLIDNGDGTYSIQADGVEGDNYLGWTSGNSGALVAKANALKLTVEVDNNGNYNIHFAANDAERYLALNETTGNNYFAWYKSGQKQNLILIPVVDEVGGETPSPDTPVCNNKCETCKKCNDAACELCTEKCDCGSAEPQEPTVVLEITKSDFNSTSYDANNNTKTENGYSYTSYQVMNQSSTMQWQKSKGYITIASNDFVKLELKVSAGTYTVTVGGKTVTGTTANGVTTYDLTGLTGEVKISVGSATGKVEFIKFYK